MPDPKHLSGTLLLKLLRRSFVEIALFLHNSSNHQFSIDYELNSQLESFSNLHIYISVTSTLEAKNRSFICSTPVNLFSPSPCTVNLSSPVSSPHWRGTAKNWIWPTAPCNSGIQIRTLPRAKTSKPVPQSSPKTKPSITTTNPTSSHSSSMVITNCQERLAWFKQVPWFHYDTHAVSRLG